MADSAAAQDRARADERLGRGQLRRQPAVRAGATDHRARRGQRGPRAGRRGERRPQVEPAGGADQLDGEDPLQVGDGPAQLAGRPPPHRHVVLLHGAGGDGVDAGRDGEPPVLGHHRRLRVVGDHHAGVDPGVGRQERRQAVRAGAVEQPVGAPLGQRAEVGDGDGEEVADVGERRAVEVAARLDPAVAAGPSGCRWRPPARDRRRPRRGRRCRAPRRGPGACSAASRRPGPGGRPRGGWRRWPTRPAAGAGWRR